MKLRELVNEFSQTKKDIRDRALGKNYPGAGFDGLTMAVSYSSLIERATIALFNLASDEMGLSPEAGVAAFLYGSPGRREMVSESDLDVMLVYRDGSEKFRDFKERFRRLAKPFEFCKIDLPDWGTIEDAEIFARKSITEGNQVLEARYICGDSSIKEGVEAIQELHGNPERMARNIVFQRFYFEQYFKQRTRKGATNVKYCDGGSRDYLFIHWFDRLMSSSRDSWKDISEERPAAEVGLTKLYRDGLIGPLEFVRALESINFSLLFRNEVLLANKGTPEEGLTFLDESTLENVYSRVPELRNFYEISSKEALKSKFDDLRKHVAAIKERIWDLMIERKSRENGSEWGRRFREASDPSLGYQERIALLSSGDDLVTLAAIWGASKAGQQQALEEIIKRGTGSDSWEIQASLANSPLCPPSHLHDIGTGIGKEKGYGYILKIVSRNPRVPRETLESIAEDPNVEHRYSKCAVAALEGGNEAANHQI